MDGNVWDGTPEERSSGDVAPVGRANVIVNGSALAVNPGDSMAETVKRMALDAGFGKFRVFLNGTDIKPADAPALISDGDRIEIKPYDVAGL